MNIDEFEQRKEDHIQLALDPAHQATRWQGYDRVELIHEALPDLNFDDIQIQSRILNQPSSTPFFVSGMTAGNEKAPEINDRLARACAIRGWAMGVGSQRRELEQGQVDPHWVRLRGENPDLFLIGNIGIAQLISSPPERILDLVSGLGAQALAIHLNGLQELIQPEGTPLFKGGGQAIEKLVSECPVPVVVKETGCGMSQSTLLRLDRLGVKAIDISGLGGTHWGRIEGARSRARGMKAILSQTFAHWGISTVDSLIAAQKAQINGKTSFSSEIWASGGVRTGLDAAKCIGLGAQMVGFAQPALQAALEGDEALQEWMKTREEELRVAMFCTGCETLEALRGNTTICQIRS